MSVQDRELELFGNRLALFGATQQNRLWQSGWVLSSGFAVAQQFGWVGRYLSLK
jgi:hypothetical protein